MGILDRFKNAWNAFSYQDRTNGNVRYNLGYSSSYRPDRQYFSPKNEKSIVTSVYNRIALDCASIKINHVYVDKQDRFKEINNSTLNNCLSFEANKDQTYFSFIQDVVQSMFDEGCVAIVPVDVDRNPNDTSSYDILTMRTGKILQWYPDYIQVEVYNDNTGRRENLLVSKNNVAIIDNPLYSVMNAPNSTLQRLIRKLNLLDAVDEQSGSGKLDLIIQLPYIIKTDQRRDQAERRRKDIEEQLNNSKYGIAYTDGTEHITQLNRPVENNLLTQITYLTNEVFAQLGITIEILNGTADENTMFNYLNRTVYPIIESIVSELNRKFLTKTARTQGQRIMYFNNPFRLIPISKFADIADKFTRNEILSSNEIRQFIGMKPIDDPKADELRNKNITPSDNQEFATTAEEDKEKLNENNEQLTKIEFN